MEIGAKGKRHININRRQSSTLAQTIAPIPPRTRPARQRQPSSGGAAAALAPLPPPAAIDGVFAVAVAPVPPVVAGVDAVAWRPFPGQWLLQELKLRS